LKYYCDRKKVISACFYLLIKKAKSNKQEDRSQEQDEKRNKPDGMGIYLYILKLFPNYEKRKIKMFSFALSSVFFQKRDFRYFYVKWIANSN